MKKPFLLGISGGSGSGKTTLANSILAHYGAKRSGILYQDSYYKDQSKNFDKDGGKVNFDHPDSLEFSLLAKQLKELKEGHRVEVPLYDFKTHQRLPKTESFEPKELVLLDGILIFSQEEILKDLDFAIFVDTPEKERFERRMRRDVRERGRTEEGVRDQFFSQVKPMHDLFVEPSKSKAHLIVSGLDHPEEMSRIAIEAIQKLLT
jgi:uridine kinase